MLVVVLVQVKGGRLSLISIQCRPGGTALHCITVTVTSQAQAQAQAKRILISWLRFLFLCFYELLELCIESTCTVSLQSAVRSALPTTLQWGTAPTLSYMYF